MGSSFPNDCIVLQRTRPLRRAADRTNAVTSPGLRLQTTSCNCVIAQTAFDFKRRVSDCTKLRGMRLVTRRPHSPKSTVGAVYDARLSLIPGKTRGHRPRLQKT